MGTPTAEEIIEELKAKDRLAEIEIKIMLGEIGW